MTVYHCPLCPLIFDYRSEVERHVRREHRSPADEDPGWGTWVGLLGSSNELDWARLQALRTRASNPSVSIVLATSPAPTMTALDVARLRRLADAAARRLLAEHHCRTAAATVRHHLSRVVATTESSPADRGLALFVSQEEVAVFSLPFEPRDRVVVDEEFATRDLDYALQRYPPIRVLALGSRPRIFEGRVGDLEEIDVRPDRTASPRVLPRELDFQDADRLLDQRVRSSGSLPLVVLGQRRRRSAFRAHSRHAPTIVGEAHRPRLPWTTVEQLALQAVSRWHREVQDRSIQHLLDANTSARVNWGLEAVWHAVADGTAERIWLEHDLARPGRVTVTPEGLDLAGELDQPGSGSDLVDALIASARRQGIGVDLLERGAMGCIDPIAVKVRSPVPAAGEQKLLHPAGT